MLETGTKAIVLEASVVSEARIWHNACTNGEKQALHVSDTCLSKDTVESRYVNTQIHNWRLKLGEPATETVPIDSAKAARGLDLGL